jgi:hypothetical protein
MLDYLRGVSILAPWPVTYFPINKMFKRINTKARGFNSELFLFKQAPVYKRINEHKHAVSRS